MNLENKGILTLDLTKEEVLSFQNKTPRMIELRDETYRKIDSWIKDFLIGKKQSVPQSVPVSKNTTPQDPG